MSDAYLLPVMMNEPIADPMENDSLQQRQQMWNVARKKPMIRRISPPPNRPCVALYQSTPQTAVSFYIKNYFV